MTLKDIRKLRLNLVLNCYKMWTLIIIHGMCCICICNVRGLTLQYVRIYKYESSNRKVLNDKKNIVFSHVHSVRTNHSSGHRRRVKTAQGRVKLTHQSSDRTSANFVWKKHHQPTFRETTATNSHSIRTLNSIPEAAILSLLVHMLSCAWWERSVQFCLVPCNECRQCGIELSNHGPVSRGLSLNGSTAHKPTTTFVIDKQVSDLHCQLETYPWPSPINGGSSGCNLDFAIINTCQGNIISSKKTEHGSVLSSTEAVGNNWACQTHGDSSKLVQFEMETSHVHSKYLIILIKQ